MLRCYVWRCAITLVQSGRPGIAVFHFQVKSEQVVPEDEDDSLPSSQASPTQSVACFPLSDEMLVGQHPHPNTPIIGASRTKEAGYRWLADITLRVLYQRILHKWQRTNTETDMHRNPLPLPYTAEAQTPATLRTWQMMRPSTRAMDCTPACPPGPVEWGHILLPSEGMALGR